MQKQTVTKQEKHTTRKKLQKRRFKVPYARKNEDTRIPSEKVNLSSAEMANTMEQKDTLSGKSVAVSNEEKLSADNIIPINILNRPSPIKEYRYNMLERSSRPSRNRVRDSKGTSITFYSNFFARKAHDLYSNITYTYGLFSVMEQISHGELLHKAMLKQKEEKRKLRKLSKEPTFDLHDMNIESKYMYTNHLFLSYFFMTKSFYCQFSILLIA